MSIAVFQPKGEKSVAQTIVDAIRDIPYGEMLTYGRLTELTGFPREVIIGSHWATNKKLLKEERKCLANVREEGYRIVEPPEQINRADLHKKKAQRQIKKGLSIITNIDLSKLTDEERVRQGHLLNHLTSIHTLVRSKQAKAISQTEKSLRLQKEAMAQLDYLAEQVGAMKKKLLG